MDNTNLFPRLRDKLVDHMQRERRNLVFISEVSHVRYSRLWRFHKGKADLPLLDADKLHIFLTGKTFITTDHV